MEFVRIANRFKEAKGEKCPKCNMITQNFLVKDDVTWVCYVCGTHFTPRGILYVERERQRERLLEQDKVVSLDRSKVEHSIDIVDTWTCPECSKPCKSRLGLASHMRVHKS